MSGKVEQAEQQLAKVKEQQMLLGCARILERLSAFAQASSFFLRIEDWNSAATCFVRANDLKGRATWSRL
jgi:WD repeat-containing protein 19